MTVRQVSPGFHHSSRGGFREEERCRDSGCPADGRDRRGRRPLAQTARPTPQTVRAPSQRTAPFVTTGPARGPVDRGSGRPRAREEHRHRRRPHHAAADRLHDRRPRGELPAEPHVQRGTSSAGRASRRTRRRASHDPTTSTTRRGRRASPRTCTGRRQLDSSLDEQPAEQRGHDQPPQPDLTTRA